MTRPCRGMREAMEGAVVGDDVYGEDPTVKELEARVAGLLGKEEALFFPSGTMANLAAAMVHCWGRGTQVILGDQSHLYLWEQGGLSQLGGISPKPLPNLADGSFSLQALE